MKYCSSSSDRADSHKYLRYIRKKEDKIPKKYEFIIPDQKDFVFSPSFNSLKVVRYYQICTFPHPKTNKYNIRRFIVNENNEFTDIQNMQLTEKQYKRVYEKILPNQYKSYATYSLDNIDYPCFADIVAAQSDILCNNYDMVLGNNAPFNH